MSQVLLDDAVELAWRHWTTLGVAGVAPPPDHAIDLEALIAFTPFVAAVDPRLERECVDWCVRVAPGFVSVARLRQIARVMPSRADAGAADLVGLVIGGKKKAPLPARLSKKSRSPRLEQPALLQLRSRRIFGLSARADLISLLVMRDRNADAQLISSFASLRYTRRAIASVVDDLTEVGLLEKLTSNGAATYRLVRAAPLRSLLAPVPLSAPRWTERFALVAAVIETWRRFGTRATYAIELAKVLAAHPLAATVVPPPRLVGRPAAIADAVERWSRALLAP